MRGLNTKITDFYVNCSSLDADVVILSETWLTSNVSSSELFPCFFNVYRSDRITGRGGGVLVAVRNQYVVNKLDVSSPVPSVQLLGIRISISSRHIIILAMYIPPSLSLDVYTSIFDYLESAIDFSVPVMLCGDFNIPEISECVTGTRTTQLFNIYTQFLALNNLVQHNSILNCNNRILDLVLTTESLTVTVDKQELTLVTEDNHHPALNIQLELVNLDSVPFVHGTDDLRFNFHRGNLEGLYLSLAGTDWLPVLDAADPTLACEKFNEIIFTNISQYVPISKSFGQRENYPVWYTRSVINKIKTKNRHWDIYRKTKSVYHLDKVKKLRCEIRKDIRYTYYEFIRKSETSLQSHPKKFWSFVNEKKKATNVPGLMTFENHTLTSQQDIVNTFASHFKSMYNCDNENHVCDVICRDNCENICDNCFKYCCPSFDVRVDCVKNVILNRFSISDNDILKAVKGIKANNVCGADNIPAFLIVDCISCFLSPLCHIFNRILISSQYPTVWKTSNVVPIFKSGDKSNIKNYRPISLIPNFAKLFECILTDAIYAHVKSDIITEQHGFVKGRSTTTNLCEFTQFVSNALDKRSQVDAIYTDLSKAFDKVNHCILLKKLESFGLCDNLISVLKSWLTDRQQRVLCKGFRSSIYKVNSGVGQGSNLGPLLFIIFYNDVVKDLGCRAFVYADDLKLAKVVNRAEDCYELQTSLEKLLHWCNSNKFEINKSKCKKITFFRTREPISYYYNLDGYVLENCQQISDLGVVMDCSLSFAPHILHVTKTAMQQLGFIRRNTMDFVNIQCIKILFYALVRSRMEYCCIVWKPYYQKYIDLLENVLRKFAKYLFLKMYNRYPSRHCDQSSLLSIVNEQPLIRRRNAASLIFLQKLTLGQICCQELLHEIKFNIPRQISRCPKLFYFAIPNTFHHYNCPLIYAFRLYNSVCDGRLDIFFHNFSKANVRKQLLELNHV